MIESLYDDHRIIMRPRRGGKTTYMLRWLKEDPSKRALLVHNEDHAQLLRKAHDVENIYTYYSVNSVGRGRIFDEVGIDELDLVLPRVSGKPQIREALNSGDPEKIREVLDRFIGPALGGHRIGPCTLTEKPDPQMKLSLTLDKETDPDFYAPEFKTEGETTIKEEEDTYDGWMPALVEKGNFKTLPGDTGWYWVRFMKDREMQEDIWYFDASVNSWKNFLVGPYGVTDQNQVEFWREVGYVK